MTPPLKIAFDATGTPEELTGAGYYVQEILKELDNRLEVDLKILTRKSDADRFRILAPNSEVLPVAPASRPARILFQSFKMGNFVDNLNVDVFHGPHYQLPFKINTPSVVTIHDMTLITHREVHNKIKP